jgi:hypothetical protein
MIITIWDEDKDQKTDDFLGFVLIPLENIV